MQKTITGRLSAYPFQELPSLSTMTKRFVEKIRLQLRAEKYRDKEDIGGIEYILTHLKKNDTVFDIGAHKGGYVYFFQEQVGQQGKVIAFEPQPRLNDYLVSLQTLLNWQNVRIERAAVSDHSGKAVLSIPYNKGKKSSPCATIIQSCMEFTIQESVEVETVSIDDYCRQYQVHPDFLKVDVEGNELSVFTGAKETLSRYRPRILFECEARFIGEKKVAETFRYLLKMGYTGYFIDGKSRKSIFDFSVSRHQNLSSGIYCNNFIFE